MALTLAQRLDLMTVRTEELSYWRVRHAQPIEGWSVDGAPIALGAPWPERQGTREFAVEAAVPADWPLAECRLRLDLGGESLITLRDEAGAEISYGLDPNHREFPLPSHRFSLSSRSVARLPFGEPVRDPRLAMADIIWVDADVERLALLLTQICETIKVLGDHEVIPHLLTAGETALRSLDWPTETAAYISRTASQPMQQKIWALPEMMANPAALSDAERDSVRLAHDRLIEALDGLQKRFPPQGDVVLTGHAHIDLAWLWPYRETRSKLRRTFHTALTLMERFEGFRFNQSTAHYYAQIAQDDPKLFESVLARVRTGQWETVGGMWIEPDTLMPSGESLARQILYGQRYFEKTFGSRHTVCWLPDCFGFSGALPQLLKQGGLENFFTIKVNWSETNRFPADLFWWEGLDGSRVLTHTFDNTPHGYNGELQPHDIHQTWRNYRAKDKHDKTLLAIGHGDGGGGVTPEMLIRQEQLTHFPALPKTRWGHVAQFFEEAQASARGVSLPVWRGEIYLELHRATLTSQSAVKRLHRRAERGMIAAETALSLAHLMGGARPSSEEAAWRVVLKNEFHDILPGSSIREVYEDAEEELTHVIAHAAARQKDALAAIAEQWPKGEAGEALLVVNPSLHPRRPDIVTPDGVHLTAAEPLPALGVAVMPRSAFAPKGAVLVSAHGLENDLLKVTLSEDGTIASLIHKPSGREAIEGRGNRLMAYLLEKPRNWDAWDIEGDYMQKGEEITQLDSLEIIEARAERGAIRLVRRWRNSTITQTLSLTAGSPRLDIETELDWHDRRVFLRSLTETSVRSMSATYECAYGVLERPTHFNRSWDAAMFEAAAHRFVDLSETGFGVALLNDAKYGHSTFGPVLGISLLRSAVYPDPLVDEGLQRFTYALMPHAGPWYDGGVREEAEALNQPLLVAPVSGLAEGIRQPLTVEGIPAGLSGLKPAEEGEGLILRLYEPAGRRGPLRIGLPEGWSHSGPLTILEEPSGAAPGELKPFEVKSWRLHNSLNRGRFKDKIMQQI
ncbi:alpha-mannosidase [Rhizobium paknamense]|uniref:Alpha-mannosidase n=1 Tax=Rhizobium paknamense TaxID=1206817 RepID=A0ABU0IGE2_9HYPH|nr:glycoside hydrolase family 38 C-terminal domain-containing protein [Rhizobium paknamense]MDQ0456742.1 alpha-mannosidase [Rhizobium paknamense]